MPTKPPVAPQWGVYRRGYTPSQPLFSAEQVETLAGILGRSPAEVEGPLAAAGLAIGPYLAKPAATERQQIAALRELATYSEALLSRLRELDSMSRHKLLKEYTGVEIDDSECPVSDSAMQQAEVLREAGMAEYNKDIAALKRLHGNIVVSRRRVEPKDETEKPKPGRPPGTGKELVRFAARIMINAFEAINGTNFPKGTRPSPPREFVINALEMIGFDRDDAPGAIAGAMKERAGITPK